MNQLGFPIGSGSDRTQQRQENRQKDSKQSTFRGLLLEWRLTRELGPQKGTLTEFLILPSGGDTSYPGLVWHEDQLWVSYYSSHEEKTAIYLARGKV